MRNSSSIESSAKAAGKGASSHHSGVTRVLTLSEAEL